MATFDAEIRQLREQLAANDKRIDAIADVIQQLSLEALTKFGARVDRLDDDLMTAADNHLDLAAQVAALQQQLEQSNGAYKATMTTLVRNLDAVIEIVRQVNDRVITNDFRVRGLLRQVADLTTKETPPDGN